MVDDKVMERIPLSEVPEGERLFTSSMLFSLKGDANNNIERAKARWVFGGHRQIEGVHYQEANASCPRWSTIRLFIAKAAKAGLKLRAGDISGAYLKAPGASTLYMRSPHDQVEYDAQGNPYVYKLMGNLYGRVEAGRQWMIYFSTFLKSIGFIANKVDPCVFERTVHVDGTTHKTSLLTYVDDLCYTGNSDEAVEHLEHELIAKFGNIKANDPDFFLGANIKQTDEQIHLCSSAMIKRMAKRFFPTIDIDQLDLTRATTPFPSHGSSLGAEVLLTDCPDIEKGEQPLAKPYREIIGALSYVALTTRPEIAFYTSQLARVQANPGEKHWKLAKHVLRYLIATPDHGLTYHREGDGLQYYVDASWADVTPNYKTKEDGKRYLTADDDGRRSSYGYIGFYASGPISWAARIQKGRRALSSMESELIAAVEASKDVIHIRQVLHDMGLKQTEPTILFEDNQSTINTVLREGITSRTKHIEVKWFWLRDIQSEVKVTKKHTSEQLADIHTKRLNVTTFSYLRDKLVQPFHFTGCIFIQQLHEHVFTTTRNILVQPHA